MWMRAIGLRAIGFAAAIGVLFAGNAAARDLYVDNVAGDDRRDGASEKVAGVGGGPCKSIRRALELAHNGDRIFLAKTDEPYRESITFQAEKNSGLPDRPFILFGNGAILDGTQEIPRRAWEPAGGNELRFRPRSLAHHLLYLEGKPAVRKPAERGAPRPSLAPREWCTWDNYVYFRMAENTFWNDYQLTFTALPVGITLYDVRNVVIRDLVVQGFQLDGINAHDDAVGVTLLRVNSRGNGRSGISVGGSSRVRILSSVVGGNGKAQVRTEGESRTEIEDSELIDDSGPAIDNQGGRVWRRPEVP